MNNLSQRDQSSFERVMRSTTGVITIRNPMHHRQMASQVVFDTFIDYLKYIDSKDLWSELFKFPTFGTNRIFIKMVSWKENVLSKIHNYNILNSIILKENVSVILYNKILRFMKAYETLQTLLKRNLNPETKTKLRAISKDIFFFVRKSPRLHDVFTIMPNRSKPFIDLLFDGIFTGCKNLEFIEDESMFDDIVQDCIDHQNDDEPPPLSSSSSSPSSDTEETDHQQKRQRTANVEQQDNNIVLFDINQFVPPPPQPPSPDFLESVRIPTVLDHIRIKQEKINEAINISNKIQEFLQNVLVKNPLSFINFIAKLNYKNYVFCLSLIDQAVRLSNYHMASTLTIALINSMQEDLTNIKTTEKVFFDDSCRKQYADLMQQMFNALEYII